jgi:hypothetical protein
MNKMLVDAQKNHNNEAVVERFFLPLRLVFFRTPARANSTNRKAQKTWIFDRISPTPNPVEKHPTKKQNGF